MAIISRRTQRLTVAVLVAAVVLAVLASLTSCTSNPDTPDTTVTAATTTSRLPIGGDVPTTTVAPSTSVPAGAFVLTATGPAHARASVAWGGGAEPMQISQETLPWTVIVEPDATPGTALTLQVDLSPSDSGTVTCTITRDGEELDTGSGAGSALCTAMVID